MSWNWPRSTPACTVAQVQEGIGWPLRVAGDLTTTPPRPRPTLFILRRELALKAEA